ncbi:XrtA/PEP-CTERM system histidine kinase PrsK [Salinimonas sediminis]|uniref:histidine kinase n=1 Tax=Salinimonas sediminis TaxID=2303538 RepID=A0A346NPQ3_9ALTE|nr:XrtA/PEP-CTERM system histidine kinase PrsK [Salinimonas sediminis]AXR07510.1 PEP-CTERM system histidine kinase PrsK [Salinimonas sediminis]
MIADIGYGMNALGYLVLLLLLFTVRKAGLAKYLLVLAALVTFGWSVGYVTAVFGPISMQYLLTADALKLLVWLLFLASCLRNDFTTIWDVLRRPATTVILAPALFTLIAPLILPFKPSTHFLLMTILSLEVLLLLEVLYRQANQDRWAYKPLVIYLGAIHLFEFVTYVNATMVNQVELGFIAARGYFYLCLLPLLVIAIRRIRHWGVDIFISRQVVLHSSIMLVAGAFLFVVAMAGYAVNYFGGSWGATFQIITLGLSLTLLAAVVTSNSLRNRVKVFITKHFFANQFDYRVEWVKLTKALTSQTSGIHDVYANALKGSCEAINYDCGVLAKVVGNNVEWVSGCGYAEFTEAERVILRQLIPFCASTNWLIDLQEYQVNPFKYEGLQLDRDMVKASKFQLVVPLFNQEAVWGFALLCNSGEKVTLNWEVRDYLHAVSEQVATYILHSEAANAVAENAQFAAFSRMSAFVLHDLKNVLAQVDLILCNAEQHKSNPEFIDDTFETLHYTKARMDKMLRQLTEKTVEDKGMDAAQLLSPIVTQVIDNRCHSLLPVPQLLCEEEHSVVVDAEKFSNVIYHLISNAQQATPDNGTVVIRLQVDAAENKQLVLVEDNGCGMDRTFIEQRLFKPFDTTKGNAGMGIGAYDAKHYMESVGGSLTVNSEVDRGSCFTLAFPLD